MPNLLTVMVYVEVRPSDVLHKTVHTQLVLRTKAYCPFLPFISSFTDVQLSNYPPSEAGNGGEGTVLYTAYIFNRHLVNITG